MTDRYVGDYVVPCPICGDFCLVDSDGKQPPKYWVVCDTCLKPSLRCNNISKAVKAWKEGRLNDSQ